ncbi:MAG: biopolymer transporter ExbD [Planctomycetales bacterium]|nr:biopolymer transporter ExbD [Planctomycetales bacterium]
MSASSSHGAEPNLTPILDMVFQLITFFMLVINFKGASMDLTLKLPVLGSARPIKSDDKAEESLMVLNLSADGKATVFGRPKDLKVFIPSEARERLSQVLAQGHESPGGELTRAQEESPAS